MNWVDGILIIMLLASVIIGSKKGLIRESIAFIVVFAAIIASVRYIDQFAIWVHEQLGGSPLISAFISFILLLAICYAGFKLLGYLFYKVANLKNTGKRDQVGGALIGFVRGWVVVAFVTFLTFLLPLPDKYYDSFETSFFGPTMAKTLPIMFDGTSKLLPDQYNFMQKIERTLLATESQADGTVMDEDRVQVHRALYQMERFFGPDRLLGS